MADVKWIKITTDIFDDEKVLLIESMPDSYAIITVWFKLLCLAGKQNNSGVFMMNDKIAYTDKMLATIFRMKEPTVQLALKTFEQFGMIELVDGIITIPNWGKHQSLDQLESKKEYMRNYMQEYRAKQKSLTCKTNSKTNGKSNVSSADKEGEKEGYKKDKNEEIKEKNKKENAYGLYSNVFLTLEEYETLQAEFPNDYVKRINALSSYIESTGKQYKNHLATIRNWASKEQAKPTQPGQACSNPFLLLAMQEEE